MFLSWHWPPCTSALELPARRCNPLYSYTFKTPGESSIDHSRAITPNKTHNPSTLNFNLANTNYVLAGFATLLVRVRGANAFQNRALRGFVHLLESMLCDRACTNTQ